MDIKNKTVLIFGGWGLVGSAIARRIAQENPSKIILTSLKKDEAVEICNNLSKELKKKKNYFTPWWGNIFIRNDFKDSNREDYLNDTGKRNLILHDTIDEFNDEILFSSSIWNVINKYKPDIIIDCINTATAIAYQNIYRSYNEILEQINDTSKEDYKKLKDSVEKLLCVSYIPQLIRHIQILQASMQRCGTGFYLKIGTSGTGGMGMNIPYTHSEEKPSRVLLSKTSIAGAQTLLLFTMARTPGGPIVKEIKPTGSIAWKKIAFGEIKKHGKPIELFDIDIKDAIELDEKFKRKSDRKYKSHGVLKSAFIDTGENGIFSRGEYETISTTGQMEFVTPEEIAENTVREIMGGNTGSDVIAALDGSVLEPTYRAGFMRNQALEKLKELEEENDSYSIAFEMLGPPRLAKLLYEAHIIRLIYKNFSNYIAQTSTDVSKKVFDLLKKKPELRNEIISIGIPVLLPGGKKLLRGPEVKIPALNEGEEIRIVKGKIDKWANDGWVDLREKNWKKWNDRMRKIIKEVETASDPDYSSRVIFDKRYWNNFEEIIPGKLVSWIFINEENGLRHKG
jgi:hypothetical protein